MTQFIVVVAAAVLVPALTHGPTTHACFWDALGRSDRAALTNSLSPYRAATRSHLLYPPLRLQHTSSSPHTTPSPTLNQSVAQLVGQLVSQTLSHSALTESQPFISIDQSSNIARTQAYADAQLGAADGDTSAPADTDAPTPAPADSTDGADLRAGAALLLPRLADAAATRDLSDGPGGVPAAGLCGLAFGLAHAGWLPAGSPLYRRIAAAVAARPARALGESPVGLARLLEALAISAGGVAAASAAAAGGGAQQDTAVAAEVDEEAHARAMEAVRRVGRRRFSRALIEAGKGGSSAHSRPYGDPGTRLTTRQASRARFKVDRGPGTEPD
jgi:hypothetical protein